MKVLHSPYVAALVGICLGSCGASSNQPTRVGSQPSWRTATQGTDDAEPAPPAPEPLVFAPTSPASSRYNDPPLAPAPSSPLGDAIVQAIKEHCETAGIKPPAPDGRLYQAAKELAQVLPDDGTLPYPVIEFALQRQGIIEPAPDFLPVAGSLDRPETLLEQLATRVPPILARENVTRFGIGTVRGDGPGRDLLVLIFQASHIKTRPIPREIAGPDAITIEGQIVDGYRDPHLFVTREDGFVVHQSLEKRGQQGFRATLSCRGRRGKQQVEITANDAGGSSVLANFPVWCQERAPTRLAIETNKDDAVPVNTVAEAEARMLALVNRDRARFGLGPLELSPELSAVARAHSTDMRDNGFVAHISPFTGSAEDRVRKARIRTALVLENVARAYGVGEAQLGLMNSPGHRANVLSKKATHIGIGIAFETTPSENRVMYFTQVFMRVPPAIKPAEARRILRARIADKRSHVREDAALSAVAQDYAQNVVAARWPEKQAGEWRNRKFDALRPRFARVGTAVVTVIDLDSLDVEQAFQEKWITHYGLGVAQGTHDEFGEGAIFIVLLLAQAR